MGKLARLISGIVVGLLGVALALNFVPSLSTQVMTIRTQAQTDALGCTAAGTTCTLTLTQSHENYGTDGMTVTETAPGAGDLTANASLDFRDRVTLTMSGLTDAVAYTSSVDYLRRHADIDSEENVVFTWFIPVALFGLMIGGGVLALRQIQGRS